MGKRIFHRISNNKLLTSILLVAISSGVFLFGFYCRSSARTTIHGQNYSLSTQIADTDALREKGLSGRISLGKNDSMLFVFDYQDYQGFWMKDMKFPIDIVWLDASKKVVTIKRNATPESYPEAYYPSAPARYVIELVSGRADELGIDIGTTLNW